MDELRLAGMSDLTITGWKPGLQTVPMMKLLMANSNMGLREATRYPVAGGQSVATPRPTSAGALGEFRHLLLQSRHAFHPGGTGLMSR